jgi:hypothetical protein
MVNMATGMNWLMATIVDLEVIQINQSEKLCITAENSGFRYKITNAWLDPNDPTVKGLWIAKDINGNIFAHSALGKFLKLMSANNTTDLIGKDVKLAPKVNDYLAIVAY